MGMIKKRIQARQRTLTFLINENICDFKGAVKKMKDKGVRYVFTC